MQTTTKDVAILIHNYHWNLQHFCHSIHCFNYYHQNNYHYYYYDYLRGLQCRYHRHKIKSSVDGYHPKCSSSNNIVNSEFLEGICYSIENLIQCVNLFSWQQNRFGAYLRYSTAIYANFWFFLPSFKNVRFPYGWHMCLCAIFFGQIRHAVEIKPFFFASTWNNRKCHSFFQTFPFCV